MWLCLFSCLYCFECAISCFLCFARNQNSWVMLACHNCSSSKVWVACNFAKWRDLYNNRMGDTIIKGKSHQMPKILQTPKNYQYPGVRVMGVVGLVLIWIVHSLIFFRGLGVELEKLGWTKAHWVISGFIWCRVLYLLARILRSHGHSPKVFLFSLCIHFWPHDTLWILAS